MKKIVLGTLALAVATGAAGAAVAADLPSRKEPPPVMAPPPPPPLWTGLYVGLNIGGGWRDNSGANNNWLLWNTPGVVGPVDHHDWSHPGHGGFPGPVGAPTWWAFSNNNSNNSAGVVGGGQIGYNYQFGTSILIGVETDFQGTSLGSGGGGGNWGWGAGSVGARLPWFGTVRGRLGWLFTPTLLLYGTGGFAYGEVEAGGWNSFSSVGTGWTAGGGVEWMFMQNWSAKVEYLYTDLSGFNSNNNAWAWGGVGGWGGGGWGGAGDRHYRFNTVRAGVNWHFNFLGGGSAPVLAKY